MALSPFLVNSIFSFFFLPDQNKASFSIWDPILYHWLMFNFWPRDHFQPCLQTAFCAVVYFPLQLPSLLGFVLFMPDCFLQGPSSRFELQGVFILKTFETVLCSQAHAANQAPGFSNTTFGCFLLKHQSRLDGKVRPIFLVFVSCFQGSLIRWTKFQGALSLCVDSFEHKLTSSCFRSLPVFTGFWDSVINLPELTASVPSHLNPTIRSHMCPSFRKLAEQMPNSHHERAVLACTFVSIIVKEKSGFNKSALLL